MTTPDSLCADIGGSFIRVATVSGTRVEGLRRAPTPAADWDALEATLAVLLDGAPASVPLGISVAGLCRPDGSVLSANIPCLATRRVAAELSAVLDRPVALANDADCFALAEAANGAGAGHRVVLGIILGSGVGGGLVVDNRIVPGAGEWGHGRVLRHGPLADLPCGCGQRGCLDGAGSARGLERLHGTGADSHAIVSGWLAGDPACDATVRAWVDILAGPLAFAVNLSSATAVPVGGGLGTVRELVAALDGAVRAGVMAPPPGPLLRPARHGGDGGLIGAAVLARTALP